MWNVTLEFGPEDVARTGLASVSMPAKFYEIGQTILLLTNKKDNEELGEIVRIEILPI